MSDLISMQLGSFPFSITTANYDQLTKRQSWKWVTLDRVSNYTSEQFTGFDPVMIELSGTIYPGFFLGSDPKEAVGTRQLDRLRALGNTKQPQLLVDGRGYVYGQFIIVSLEETQTAHLDNGAPRKQEFNLSLRSYTNDNDLAWNNNQLEAASAKVVAIAQALNADLPGLATTVSNALNALGVSQVVSSAIGSAADSANALSSDALLDTAASKQVYDAPVPPVTISGMSAIMDAMSYLYGPGGAYSPGDQSSNGQSTVFSGF